METDTYYNNDTDFYASDPERMYETLHWIMTRYPAETYGLVLWGHASGWVIEKDSISPLTGHEQAAESLWSGLWHRQYYR